MPAISPVSEYTQTLVRRIGSPAYSAAFSLSPMARTCRPNTVRASTVQNSTAAPANAPITIAFWRNSAAKFAATSRPNPISMFSLLVSHFARPRSPIMDASVTMNGCTRIVAMVRPLIAPASMDAATATATAIAMWLPYDAAGQAGVRHIAVRAVDIARILPTLRSIPPVRITKVMAREIMPMSEICRRISVRLPACRKMREPSPATGLVIAASARIASSARIWALRSTAVISRTPPQAWPTS